LDIYLKMEAGGRIGTLGTDQEQGKGREEPARKSTKVSHVRLPFLLAS
jgi:hypothetical protein